MPKVVLTLGDNIKIFRKKRGISQDKLSKFAGVAFHTIVKIEAGTTPDPRIDTVNRIAKALNVSVDSLLRK